MSDLKKELDFDYSKYAFKDPELYVYKAKKGLSREIIEEISRLKNEPSWMTEFRLKAYDIFVTKPMPTWGANLSEINFDDIVYYIKPTDKKGRSWDEVPEYIKRTFERLGIPEAERKFLAGVGAQYESEVVYHSIRKDLEAKGVIFTDMDTAVKEYPDIVRKYFGTVVPPNDNKFAALNSAVWSGGSFIYVPEGVEVDIPLQAYFRINAANVGQFERTLIIAEPYSKVHYIEGCLPPGELVSLGHETRNIEEIKLNDTVLTHAGNHKNVKAIMIRRHKGEMITIIPQSKGNAFQLTPEHPVWVIKKEKVQILRRRHGKIVTEISTKKLLNTEPEFVPAENLKVGDFLVYVVPKDEVDYSELDENVLKLLGLYLAEGSVSYNRKLNMYVLTFSFGKDDKEKKLAEETKELIEKLGEKAYLIKTKKGYYNVSTYSKRLIELCITHCGRDADKKALSETIMKLPIKKQKVFLDYYIKGDRNIYIKKPYFSKMVRVSTVSKKLAFQLQEILARMGVFANISIRKGGEYSVRGRIIRRKTLYIIQFTENIKFSRVRKKNNYFFVPIVEIKKEPYDNLVFNLEVADDNTYLVKGFAVHNCTAPIYSTDSLHAAVVEIIAKKGAKVRYTTIQNWSTNVYNLVTKRAFAYEDATVEWVDGNIGSKVTMKYPAIYLLGKGAKGEVISVAYAKKGQHQDTGAKIYHLAPYTTSRITSKSISKDGGRTTYRGLVYVAKGAKYVKSSVRCDALLLDDISRTDTYPYEEIQDDTAIATHEATVSKISEDQLFYLMSRGIPEIDALNMIVMGFLEPFTKELPMEYALELNRLMKLEMQGSVG